MEKPTKNTLGKKGEQYIVERIKKKGWEVLETNFHNRFGEIDIIAKDGDEVVFIEVKTRTNDFFGTPEESVTKYKLQKILSTAQNYLLQKKWEDVFYRFDVFSVLQKNGTVSIEHFKNISFAE
jgi:putative endonuclease